MTEKEPITRAENIDMLWINLVESAFDFFERAISEHDTEPKYAILHLATSIELFLKARLMAEHWTLIISPNKPLAYDNLINGDFLSITPTQAADRIKDILPFEEHLSKKAKREFDDLGKERNKIAHFFHTDLNTNENPHSIIQRQCRVWRHLHHLLSNNWKSTFSHFNKRLIALNKTMCDERKFLNTIFDDVKPDLDKHRQSKLPVIACPTCDFEALALQNTSKYTSGQCHVCLYQNNTLMQVECPDCAQEVVIDHGNDHCPKCAYFFKPNEVAYLIGCTLPSLDDYHDSHRINCSDCETDNVYEYHGIYICLNCMQESSEIEMCEWCNEYNTGDMEFSRLNGCSMCDGMIGWHSDKD